MHPAIVIMRITSPKSIQKTSLSVEKLRLVRRVQLLPDSMGNHLTLKMKRMNKGLTEHLPMWTFPYGQASQQLGAGRRAFRSDLPGVEAPPGRSKGDEFWFSKRVTSLLRGYDHASLKPHHKIIPPEFDARFLMD